MTDIIYKCGHKSRMMILSKKTIALANWIIWDQSVGLHGTREKCYNCWLKEQKEEQGK